jgi:hypothetical protein
VGRNGIRTVKLHCSHHALIIPALSKLLLKRLPREDIDALRGVRGVREPSPRIARFCSIVGVSRGVRGIRESLGSESSERCAERRSSSASISIRRTSSSTAPSSSGDLCLPLLLGAFVGDARNFFLGGWDGPATALMLLEGG